MAREVSDTGFVYGHSDEAASAHEIETLGNEIAAAQVLRAPVRDRGMKTRRSTEIVRVHNGIVKKD